MSLPTRTKVPSDRLVYIYRVGQDLDRDIVTGQDGQGWFQRHRVGLLPDTGVNLIIQRLDDGTLQGVTWRYMGSSNEDGTYNIEAISSCENCPSCVKGEEYVFTVDELPPFRGDYDERNTADEQRMDKPRLALATR